MFIKKKYPARDQHSRPARRRADQGGERDDRRHRAHGNK